jgi:hypothetical protein
MVKLLLIKLKVSSLRSMLMNIMPYFRKTENENSIENSEILFFLLLILIFFMILRFFIIVKSLKVRNDELELFTVTKTFNYSLSLIEASLDPLITINIEVRLLI